MTNEYGEKKYQVGIGTGTMYPYVETVWAYSEQEAVDKVVDMLEAENSNLIADYYELYDLCEAGQTVDDYAYENGLVVAGNSGWYVDLKFVKEI